jgi:hypothetical protein
MKRLLLCALFLLLCDCSQFPLNRGGVLYTVTCIPNPITGGVVYTIFETGELLGTGDQSSSTCAQVQKALEGGAKPGTFLHLAKTTAAAAQPLEYLLDQASLSVQVLDLSTFNLTEVDLPGGGYTQYPTNMDITPDGSTIWVTQLAGLGPSNAGITLQPPLVSIMNVAQQAFTGGFTLPNGISPNTIQFSLDGTSAYISNDGSPGEGESAVFANSSVLVVDVAIQTVTKTIPTPKGAGSAVLSPDGLLLYTIGNNDASGAPNNLTVIDTTTNTVATSVALPDGGIQIFVNPTGTRLYVLWVRGIDVFDTASLQQVASIPASNSSHSNFAYFTPDGATAWLCGCGYGVAYQMDVRTNQVVNTIQVQTGGFMFGTP